MKNFYTPNGLLTQKFESILKNGSAKEEVSKRGYETIEVARILKIDGSSFKWCDYTPFDKIVHDAICSLYENNITEFSRVELWRMITGVEYEGSLSNEMLNDIDIAIQKMFLTGIELKGMINNKEFCYKGALISCSSYTEKINGGIVYDVIKVHTIPPFLAYSKLKKQVISFPSNILLLGDKNTSFSAVIKHYIIKQIEIFKNQKNYRNNGIILLDTLYRECGITDKTRKYRARKHLFSLLDDFIKEGYIKGYTTEMKNQSVRAIKIELKGN